MVRACCVSQCKSGKQVPSHHFPTNPIRCHEWIKSLNLHFLEKLCANELKKHKICYKHFREEDYRCSLHRRFLIDTAIPVLHINICDDSVDVTVHNVQQQPLQPLSKENEQRYEILQSVLTDVSRVQKQVQQHSEQLAEQQNLLETWNAQQMILSNKVLEIQQKINEKDITKKNDLQQSRERRNNEEERESIIHDQEKRLERIEEQSGVITPKRNRRLRMRPNLQNITRARNLTPTSRMLYNITVGLRRANTRLKRLLKRQKGDHRRKPTLHNKII